jgi:prevent-host-death family protein
LSKLTILDKLYIFCYSVSMQTVSASYAKQNFAAILDMSQREPVMIQRHERDIAVLMSAVEYDRIQQMRIQKQRREELTPAEYLGRE